MATDVWCAPKPDSGEMFGLSLINKFKYED